MDIATLTEKARVAINRNELQSALEFLQSALRIEPDNSKLLSQLGICLMLMGNSQAAIAAFERAHSLDADSSSITNNLIRAYLKVEQDQSAASLLKRGGGTPALFTETALALRKRGQIVGAIDLLTTGLTRFPDSHDLLHLRGALASSVAPMWHIPMTAHSARNRAYRKSIEKEVRAGDVVLDIGTGSGLLAMMAVRAGCGHVYACEANPLLADIARKTIAANDMEAFVTVIEKHSTDLIVGEDLPVRADVLVTEIFDNALVGEGALPSIKDARTRLLKEDARLIPNSATLKGAVVSSPGFAKYHEIKQVEGFDLRALNVLSHPLSYKDSNTAFNEVSDNVVLSEAVEIFTWDFNTDFALTFEQKFPIRPLQDGVANAVLMWFELTLHPEVTFSTADPAPFDHWREVLQPIAENTPLTSGQEVNFCAEYDRYFRFYLTAN